MHFRQRHILGELESFRGVRVAYHPDRVAVELRVGRGQVGRLCYVYTRAKSTLEIFNLLMDLHIYD